ncbi:MAG: tRNA dihydrouridine synthase DusB [Candidatus Omnitrophica bacterium]|nr:tRNA dihydrouridine synthase DusB [Candidatus Omnitrophota bacterium]
MIQLKDLKLKTNIIQSPMAGCTDLAFRLVAREHGMEMAFMEMVSCESLIRNNRKALELMKTVESDRPLGCQLVGCRAEAMGEAAAIAEGMGYDLIDINIGCPVPKITGPGGGSALLKEPDNARAIFKAMQKNIKRIPFTAKMRLGFADPTGDEAIRMAQIAEGEGLAAVSVHGRTREQAYSGKADWAAIGRVKRAVKIPVFGNGDVNSGEDAQRMLDISGCDGVMLGRGALGNPWIYRSVQAVLDGKSVPDEPTLEERKKAFLHHAKLEIENEGPMLGVLKCRKIACWYFKGFSGAAELRGKVNQIETPDALFELIHNFHGHPSRATPGHDDSIPNDCSGPVC